MTIKIQSKSRLHEAQDLQSLALHEAAVSKVEQHPGALQKVVRTLKAWREANPDSRSMSLWKEWEDILHVRAWRRALAPTQRAKQLRQASPLAFALSEEERRRIIAQVNVLKRGVTLGGADAHTEPWRRTERGGQQPSKRTRQPHGDSFCAVRDEHSN